MQLERGRRPLGRKKNVTGGSSRVRRRGQGLHTGPAGQQGGYGRESRAEGFGGNGSRGPAGARGQREAGSLIGNMVMNEAMNELSGRKKKNPLILILAAVLFLGGGGMGLGSLLGGGSTGLSDSHVLTGSFGGDLQSWGGSGGYGGYSQSETDLTGGTLNTSVARGAREKRTRILGEGRDTITIMVYMCGTDLESRYGMATSDLQEMAKAQISDNINLLVYTGGCQQWKNKVISNRTNQIYQVENGGITPLVQDIGSKPMTDPDTLSEYIRWAKKQYPADRYDLIFWDHGGGSTSGYGYDQIHSRSGSMTLDKIGQALQDGGCTFDFIGFDACLMATLETALVVEPYADYLIASEETEPGVGWYYTDWLTKLSQNSSMPTIEIGKNIVDDFVAVCGERSPRDQTTLSVIDLAELAGTVPQKFQEFAEKTTELIRNDAYQTVSNARSQTKEFAKSSGIDQVDLIHLAQNMGTQEGAELEKSLKSVVKYNRTSSNVSHANGISIYFPYGRMSSVNQMAATYEKIGLDDSYTDCIKSFASLEASGQIMAGGSQGQLQSLFGSLLSGGSGYAASGSGVSGDMVSQLLSGFLSGRSMPELGLDEAAAGFADRETIEGAEGYLSDNQFDPSYLVWEEKDGQEVLELPEEQWELIQNVELNVFVDDGEGFLDLGLDNVYDFNEEGDLLREYDETWLAIDGQIVAYYMLAAEGDEDAYTISGRVPALLNGERVDLILQFTNEDPDGSIIGARICYDEEAETATQARGLLALQEGDVIDFICDYYDYDQNYQDSYYLGEQIVVQGTPVISNVSMENENFLAAYRLTDIYRNHYWTPSL